MITEFNLTFPHNYEVEIPAEMSSGQSNFKTFYFPNGIEIGGYDGIMVKVIPNGNTDPWFGIFSFGERKQINGVFSCPENDKLCVIAAGRGYVVSVNLPTNTYEIPVLPITDVRLILERKLLLFADFTKIVALGDQGIAWKSQKLSWDGVQILGFDSDHVWGKGWSPVQSDFIEFNLDLQNGQNSR